MEWLGRLETSGNPPCPRKGHSMTRLLDSSLVLVFGGEMQTGNPVNDMYCLNVDTRVWRKIHYANGPVPSPRLLHTATAVSSSAMVVMGGDSVLSPTSTAVAMNDVWYFDVRLCSWREIKCEDTMPPRSCHSAVFGNSPGHVPAIYVFGGFGLGEQGSSAMYRLRIGDWKWECLPIVVTGPDGKEQVVQKPVSRTQSKDGTAGEDDFPSARESHGAIWLPALNGMMIVGGDGGYSIMDDCWLFVPSSKKPGAWKWRKLNLRMARGLIKNKLPLCAGTTLISLPTEKTQVLMWGGIQGPIGEASMPPNQSYLLDIDAMQCTCLVSNGEPPEVGRLLHGFVRVGSQMLAFGGCDSAGNVLDGLEHARLLNAYKSVGLRATDFGPLAAKVAAGEDNLPTENGTGEGSESESETNDSGKEEAAKLDGGEANIPLLGPSTISKGTPLSGRIIEETDYGYFVQVVISGKLYKGVLVANPLKQSEMTSEDKALADREDNVPQEGSKAPEQNNGEEEESPPRSPEPKRLRVDSEAEMLPDSPPGPKKFDANEVISIE